MSSPNNILSVNVAQAGIASKPKAKRSILPKKSLVQLYITNSGAPSDTLISSKPKSAGKQFNFIKPRPFSLESFEYNPSAATNNPKEYSFTSTTSTFASSQNVKPTSTKKCVKEKKLHEITRMCLDESNKHEQHLSMENSFKTDEDALQNKFRLGTAGENAFRKRQSMILNHLAKEFFLGMKKIYIKLSLNKKNHEVSI